MVSDGSPQSEQTSDKHSAASPNRPKPIGRIREYELLQKIGQGGMGTVYKASHTMLERLVAIKLLPSDRMNSEESVSRFRREMKAVGKLIHPNIVHASDAGEERGVHFLVMEYVDGLDLGAVIKRVGPLPVADACEIIRQAAFGLQHAHEHGMVHRDIKPSNLLLSRRMDALVRPPSSDNPIQSGSDEGVQATVKILDLGLALLSDADRAISQNLTSTGQIMGTLDYMAPEQADDTHAVDIRADIYSLGCTLYALLAGTPPFGGLQYTTPVRKLAAHMQKPVPPIRDKRDDVPEELVVILERLLAKRPDERFATPGEVATALQPFVEGSDLPQLLEQAIAAQPAQREADSSLRETEGQASSPLTGTRPSQFPLDPEATSDHRAVDTTLASPPPSSARSVKLRAFVALGVTLLLIACGVIIIKIRDKSGRVIGTVTVPEGGSFEVTEDAPAEHAAVIEEPPPFDEWLESREIITVAQDGSGDYDTIQAAVNALKAGQAVKVLDKGPYRERLIFESLPDDVGLISETGTVIKLKEWGAASVGFDGTAVGHVIDECKTLRIHGFDFDWEPAESQLAFHVVFCSRSANVCFEACRIRTTPLPKEDQKGATLVSYGNGRVAIQDCQLSKVGLCPGTDYLVQRNLFRGLRPFQLSAMGIASGEHGILVIRHNVFSGTTGIQVNSVAGAKRLEVSNNTFHTHPEGIEFYNSPLDSGVFIMNNVIGDSQIAYAIGFAGDSRPSPKWSRRGGKLRITFSEKCMRPCVRPLPNLRTTSPIRSFSLSILVIQIICV